ncbi:anaerobic sulfite reductase subunit AsrA [Vibrio sp. NTOU-M3]|uniref:anaerobic sulfite reductase subunit AsrA n=1 Tax=Vibrio sp. NTOU-M3 TaxID=3234954 RepID=UPI00349F0A4E
MPKFLTTQQMEIAIETLRQRYKVMAPVYQEYAGRFAHTANLDYQELTHYGELVWKEKSHFSPKEIVFPITETLFWFNADELKESSIDARPVLLFLRACDINAIKSLDYMFLKNGGHEDFYYKRLRQKLKLVLIECSESFENCFCVSMGSNKTNNFAASVLFSEQGATITIKDPELTSYFSGGSDVEHDVSFATSNYVKVKTPDSVCDNPAKVREILLCHPAWSEYNSRCIGCGRCTSSCPSCACFNVFDVVYNQEGKVGERRRQHASCMIDGFSDMAGGHSFRHKTSERLRYRALHKVNDFKSRQGEHHMCVGCGRCDDRCPHYISFSNIINKMTVIVEEAL